MASQSTSSSWDLHTDLDSIIKALYDTFSIPMIKAEQVDGMTIKQEEEEDVNRRTTVGTLVNTLTKWSARRQWDAQAPFLAFLLRRASTADEHRMGVALRSANTFDDEGRPRLYCDAARFLVSADATRASFLNKKVDIDLGLGPREGSTMPIDAALSHLARSLILEGDNPARYWPGNHLELHSQMIGTDYSLAQKLLEGIMVNLQTRTG